MNKLIIGKQYKCRGGHVATIEKDVSEHDRIYPFFGHIAQKNGNSRLAFFMSSGHYDKHGESEFDLVEEVTSLAKVSP